MHELVQIAYSPWSERARWALDHHGIPHRRAAFLPGVSAPRLRWRLRRPTGPVSVPVLFPDDGPPVPDSLAIARWAEARGDGPPLFRPGRAADDARWHALSEDMLAAGRVIATRRALRDPSALRELLPPFLRPLGPLGLAVGRWSARDLLRRYPVDDGTDEACLATLEAGLVATRAALGGGSTLTDGFGWADLTMACGLAFVRPAADERALGPEARRLWTVDDLAGRFADVLAWRDEVRARHRPRRVLSGAPASGRATQ